MTSVRRSLSRPFFLCSLITFSLLTAAASAQVQTMGVVKDAGFPAATALDTPKPSSRPASTDTDEIADTAHPARLGAGDMVEVSVYNVPELSTKARVGNNGDVYLPLIDYVHIDGLTVEQAQEVIEKRLSDGGFVKDAHVTVLVNESASQGVNVLGQVAKPGVYPVLGQRRLFDLISAAGGLSDKAGRSVTVTHRDQPEKPVVVALGRDLSDNPEANVEVFPGDTVLVRKSDVVYVVGEVARPSGFMMEGGSLTVLQAIALAGGTMRTAKLSDARILHKSATGVAETHIQLKKILSAKAPDVAMQADDILFIPTSTTRIISSRSLEAVIQTATALSLVAVRP